MKKLLFMNDLVYGGGVEKVMLEVVSNLPHNQYDITIITPYKDENIYNYYSNNTKYLYINEKEKETNSFILKFYYKFIRKIKSFIYRRRINKQKFDCAIAFKEGPCMKYISQLRVSQKLAWIHVDYNILHWTKDMFRGCEEINCMKKFDKVICVSNAVKESVIKNVGDPGNLCVRYNPLDAKEILKKSIDHINEMPPPKDKQLFITVGRLSEVKGYDRLLKVCNQLNRQGYVYELWIIGDGEQEVILREFIKKNRLFNVKLLGVQNNPYKYIKVADWFICSSISESFGVAIQEAIILGVPVITTNCPGACELLDDGLHGIIVENSEEGILNGIKKVLSDLNLKNYYKNKMKGNLGYLELGKRLEEIKELFS
ncbi:MAG: glycosyltransferase [Clostridiaceae bacterium]